MWHIYFLHIYSFFSICFLIPSKSITLFIILPNSSLIIIKFIKINGSNNEFLATNKDQTTIIDVFSSLSFSSSHFIFGFVFLLWVLIIFYQFMSSYWFNEFFFIIGTWMIFIFFFFSFYFWTYVSGVISVNRFLSIHDLVDLVSLFYIFF